MSTTGVSASVSRTGVPPPAPSPPGAARQRAFGTALDHRAVRHRVGERHPQFEDIGAGVDQRMQDRDRRRQRRIARGDERHQRLAPGPRKRAETRLQPILHPALSPVPSGRPGGV